MPRKFAASRAAVIGAECASASSALWKVDEHLSSSLGVSSVYVNMVIPLGLIELRYLIVLHIRYLFFRVKKG
jgi:hypothetical protein